LLAGCVDGATKFLAYIRSRIDQLACPEKLEVQEPAIAYGVQFSTTFDERSLNSGLPRFTTRRIGSLIEDVIGAFETSLMPNKDLALLCDTLGWDVPDLEYASPTDRPHDPPLGKHDFDVATATWE
jgi:hypothetical protein